jgi:hypothetical protein
MPDPFVEVNPDDASKLGLAEDGFARVSTAHGSAVLRVNITAAQVPGRIFVPIHWNDETAGRARVGALVHPFTDPHSGQGLEAVRTPEDMPIPQNRLAEIRRDMAWLAMLREQIKAIEKTRLERLQQAPGQGRMRWCLFWLASSGPASTTRTCWCGRSPRTRQELAKNLPRTCGTNPSAGAGAVARYGYWLLLAG